MVLLTACGSNKPKINEKPYEDKQFLMGTYVQMRIYDDGKEAALKPAFKRVKELADKITVNQEGSEIDAVNNVYVMGHSPRGNQKEDWTVGIQDPNQARNVVLGSVPESNMSLVTSGRQERYQEADGKTYHHLVNPKTGYPFDNDIAGVTIVSKKSIDGDGLSTAVFSMGVKEGLKYVEGLKDTEAIFVTRDDKVYVTAGLKDIFELNKEAGYKMGNDKDLK